MTKPYIFIIINIFLLTLNNTMFGQKDSTLRTVETFTVPAIQAEYIGGYKQLTKYLKDNVVNKLPPTTSNQNIEKVVVKFFVDENGKTTGATIFKTSTDPKVDKLFIDAINNMPQWKPAENPKGKKTKQEFTIPLYICLK